MARGGRSRGRRRDAAQRSTSPRTPGARSPKAAARRASEPASEPEPPRGPFRLGAIPGATPGKWIATWRERMPQVELELVPLTVAGQRTALTDGTVDAALVRLPIDREGLHVISLYDEVAVVVMSAESHLTAADELEISDLDGEVVITPSDDALGIPVPGGIRPAFDPPETTADAIAVVAAGVGIAVVPMSLARLHHRKDIAFRPLRSAPASTVALAWPADRTSPLVETFVGIVRGRTANSSRD